MDVEDKTERVVVRAWKDVPNFSSEEEERAWWATHEVAEELGRDVTEEQRARIRRAAQRAGLQQPVTTATEPAA